MRRLRIALNPGSDSLESREDVTGGVDGDTLIMVINWVLEMADGRQAR